MVFPSPRSGHNLKSLHKKGIIPLFGWYCPFWASYLFKAASGWPRGRFLHYKRCSTPAGSVRRFQASAPAFLPLWALLLFLQHSFPIVSAGLAGLYASFMGLPMNYIAKLSKSPLLALFRRAVPSAAVWLRCWGDLFIWPRSDAGPYTFQRVGCLAAAADRCTKFIDAKSAWMNKMQGCPCGWYGYNAAAHLPGWSGWCLAPAFVHSAFQGCRRWA